MIFSEVISNWYQKNGRNLPWRQTNDPYKIWLSEVILQQTRVDQGMPYYIKFIDKYPDIQSLADADEQSVLKDWQGLGYYSRARNLLAAAKQIVNDYDGEFPENHNDIRSLKGVGEYTAAAISSFAFGSPYPVVDGNVIRFLSRYFGIREAVDTAAGARMIRELASQVFNEKDPAIHNQAIMEFGALQCVPHAPDCTSCPLSGSCIAHEKGNVNTIPVKSRKQKVTRRYFHYMLINMNDRIGIRKRNTNDIWKNLFELPMIETPGPVEVAELLSTPDWAALFSDMRVNITKVSSPVIHKLSHREIIARFIELEMKGGDINILPDTLMVHVDALPEYPVPRLLENFLSESIKDYNTGTQDVK